MAFHYEVVVESALAALFRQKFLQNMGKTKCCEMFKLMSPGMPNLWEFKIGKEIFTLSFNEEAGGEEMERMAFDSMTLDLKDIILSTIQDGMYDYLMNFLAPLSQAPKEEIENRIKTYCADLVKLV